MATFHGMQWDDVRVFLATMRAGSLRQAAAELGVSHPTARRRLDALEQSLNLKLFERRTDGLHATPEAALLRERAEVVEQSMHALDRTARAAHSELRGTIRVTLPDILATDLLMPDFMLFQARWPGVELEIDTSYGLANLSRREADVAIRFMRHGRPPDNELAGRLAATSFGAVYGTRDRWLGWKGAAEDRSWVEQSPFPDLPVHGAINNGYLQRQACAGGLGKSLMPCFFAEPLLKRCTQPFPDRDIWVLVHPDLRRNPLLRSFRDTVVEAIRAKQGRLDGLPECAADAHG